MFSGSPWKIWNHGHIYVSLLWLVSLQRTFFRIVNIQCMWQILPSVLLPVLSWCSALTRDICRHVLGILYLRKPAYCLCVCTFLSTGHVQGKGGGVHFLCTDFQIYIYTHLRSIDEPFTLAKIFCESNVFKQIYLRNRWFVFWLSGFIIKSRKSMR